MLKVRTATAADAEEMLSIYAPHVLRTAVTFETAIPSIEEFENRISKCLQGFPWLVCEDEGLIAGYVYATTHREREAYQWTCESSVYVRDGYKGKRIGKNLYAVLFQLLKLQGLINLYAGITLPNEASVKLHENCGFIKFAEYNNIGYKSGQWHNVSWWKVLLGEHQTMPSPPLPFSKMETSLLTPLFTEATGVLNKKIANGK